MSMIEILGIVKLVCFGLAALFLIVGVILFFVLHITRVFGDLSGRTAKKEIENIRSKNVQSGDKLYKPSYVNQSRGKLTAKISESGKVADNVQSSVGTMFETEKINMQTAGNQTTLLDNGMHMNEQTTLLQNSTQIEGETTLLNDNQNQTTVLSSQQDNGTTVLGTPDGSIEVLDEIVYVYTNDIIS